MRQSESREAPDTVVVRPAPKGRRVVLFADMAGSADRRDQMGPEQAYIDIREHNRIVASVVAEARRDAGSNEDQVVKYIGDGVLATFAEEDAHIALQAAKTMRTRLRTKSRGRGKNVLRSRIGMALGEVWLVRYCEREGSGTEGEAGEDEVWIEFGAPDWHGVPIDVAARLISDVAEPGEIIVDQDVKEIATEQGYEEDDFAPPEGETLEIAGHDGPVRLFVLADGSAAADVPAIRNRRQLARDLSVLVKPAVDLRLKAGSIDGILDRVIADPSAQHIRAMSEHVREMTRMHKDLEQKWENALEVKRHTDVEPAFRTLTSALENLAQLWPDAGGHLNRGLSQASEARASATPAAEAAVGATEDFARAVSKSLDTVLEGL